MDASDIELRYQKLGSLQQSFDVLRKVLLQYHFYWTVLYRYFAKFQYSLDQTKVDTFEKMKDEFLSWYSPATILAIDSNDLKQLENIKEKYLSLDRLRGSFENHRLFYFVIFSFRIQFWQLCKK